MATITPPSVDEIRAKLAELESDERLTKYPPATVFANAPLALIQANGAAQIDTLRWVLGLPAFRFPRPLPS